MIDHSRVRLLYDPGYYPGFCASGDLIAQITCFISRPSEARATPGILGKMDNTLQSVTSLSSESGTCLEMLGYAWIAVQTCLGNGVHVTLANVYSLTDDRTSNVLPSRYLPDIPFTNILPFFSHNLNTHTPPVFDSYIYK